MGVPNTLGQSARLSVCPSIRTHRTCPCSQSHRHRPAPHYPAVESSGTPARPAGRMPLCPGRPASRDHVDQFGAGRHGRGRRCRRGHGPCRRLPKRPVAGASTGAGSRRPENRSCSRCCCDPALPSCPLFRRHLAVAAVSLALVESARDVARREVELKWPNDRHRRATGKPGRAAPRGAGVATDCKVAGLLAESTSDGAIVVGAGVNVAWAPDG